MTSAEKIWAAVMTAFIAGLIFTIGSCGRTETVEITRRVQACVAAGGQWVSGDCLRGGLGA